MSLSKTRDGRVYRVTETETKLVAQFIHGAWYRPIYQGGAIIEFDCVDADKAKEYEALELL